MKKITWLLTVAVLFCVLCVATLSSCELDETDSPPPSEGLKYIYNQLEDAFYVSGIGSCEDNIVVVPSKYDGKPVVGVADRAFYNCDSFTIIKLPSGIKSIGDSAFENCSSLGGITIPTRVTNIGDGAFKNCDSLTTITIPNSVTSIGDSAFSSCDSLASITIPDSVTSIGNEAFAWCENLASITIPDSVTSIGDSAFYYCKSLTDIYCEADSKPSGWNSYWWVDCKATVHWGNK